MIRWAVVASLVLGCGGTKTEKPTPVDPASAAQSWVDETLGCIVSTLTTHANASNSALDVVTQALDVTVRPLDRVRARKLVDRIVAAIDKGAFQAPKGTLLAMAALATAELGDLPAAQALAERAVKESGTADPDDRNYAIQRAVEVLAWTGAADRARTVAGARPIALASVANGMARRGDKAGAQRILVELAAKPFPDPVTGMIVAMGHARSGDLVAARRIVDAQTTPDHRAFTLLWVADAAVRSEHPDRIAFVDAAIAESETAARANEADALALTVWIDLVRLRDKLGGTPKARAALHEWLLGGAPGSLRNELLGINVIRSQVAGLPAEADRLLAVLPPQAKVRATLDLAQARGEFAQAFDQIETHRREREALRAQKTDLPPEISESIDAVEVDLWLDFATPDRDPALVTRFRALVCP